jgi:glutamyl-tRNA reductase
LRGFDGENYNHKNKDVHDLGGSMVSPVAFEPDVTVRAQQFRIGCIGAGMIMAECHLAAYKDASFIVAAIASRTASKAEAVAQRWGIPKVYATPEALIEDPSIEILDIAYPPDL